MSGGLGKGVAWDKAWEVKVQLESYKNFGRPNLPQLLTVATISVHTTAHPGYHLIGSVSVLYFGDEIKLS